ncbi:MAG: SAM-dependent methyltransferase [Bacteroidales bacterium]|nr:SAM-dependent methyltransferase [Bacteroidales bacterium]
MLVLNQIEARQRLSKKVPSWASNPDLLFPKHISIEQCSSELTAKYKASIISGGDTFVDLTGGLGIDSYFLSEKFKTSYYVENQEELCDLAEHNFQVLDRKITVVNSDAESFLSKNQNFDLIFIDPARRDIYNRKMVSLHDCSPDVIKIVETFPETSHVMFPETSPHKPSFLIKASPMLDISLITNELQNISEIHIVSVKNECKEILIKIEPGFEGEIKYFCVNFVGNDLKSSQSFEFSETSESSAIASFAPTVKRYLYEPNASLMKSGAFKLISQRFGIEKLHVNSHLYTSDTLISEFPGRIFEVVGFAPFNKKIKKELLNDITEASVATRNFPLSANELRKALNLKESDKNFVFGTTLIGEKKVVILAKKYKE